VHWVWRHVDASATITNMIGREYRAWGNKRNIKSRFGDNRGNPFTGPLTIRALNANELLVCDKFNYFHIQDLSGAVKSHFYPLSSKNKVEEQLEMFILENGLDAKPAPHRDGYEIAQSVNSIENEKNQEQIQEQEQQQKQEMKINNILDNGPVVDNDDWQAQYLAKETNQLFQGKFSTTAHYLDMMPIAFDYLHSKDILAIIDNRCTIKLFQVSTLQEIRSFSSMGVDPGYLSSPTSISFVLIGSEAILAIGESGAMQRIQLFTLKGEFLCCFGSKGPMLGQFRDISSISSFQPKSEVVFDHIQSHEYTPEWFKGEHSLEDLEDFLLDENLSTNFVVGQKQGDLTQYIVVYISPAKSIDRFILKYDQSDRSHSCFYVTNLLVYADGHNRPTFPSMLDFIKSQKRVLHVRHDVRDFVLLAVTDRKNFRVQILKYYFTKNKFYTPSLEVVACVGGMKANSCELRDPLSATFSKFGELAICDNGRNVIVLLSRQYSVIKTIQLPFVSVMQIKGQGRFKRRNFLTDKELESAKKPCEVQFLDSGELLIAYRSGGQWNYRVYAWNALTFSVSRNIYF
jgi:hypothetical protein